MRTNKTVPLGSGRVYVKEFIGPTMPTAAELVAMCIDENLGGESKGGSTIMYTADKHKEQDDHGYLVRTIATEEAVKLKCSYFSWGFDFLEKLAATCRHETEGDYTVYKLGGLSKDNGKRYIVIFEHIDPELGNAYFAIVGTNGAGITLAFARDNTTKLEPEFDALPHDGEGTLLKFFEALPASSSGSGG